MIENFKKGMTLTEVLIVVGVVALLISVTLPSFSSIKENQTLKSGVADVISALEKARSKTLTSVNSSEYGVHFESSQVIIFTGTTYSSSATDNEAISIVSPTSISNISLTGGVSDIYFKRLSGEPNVTGTITISTTNFSKIVTIGATGIVSSN